MILNRCYSWSTNRCPYFLIDNNVQSRTPKDQKRKKLKGPTDYRPAGNTYPVKTLQRDGQQEMNLPYMGVCQ